MDKVVMALMFALLLSVVGVVGDFFVKIAGASKVTDYRWLIIGAVIYGATALGWFYVMKHVKLSTLGVYSSVATVLLITAMSVLYFKERINSMEVVGIAAAIVSLVLLARFA